MTDDKTKPMTQLVPGSIAAKMDAFRRMAEAHGDRAVFACEHCKDTTWAWTPGGMIRCPECRRDYPLTTPLEFQACTLRNYEPLPGNRAALRVAHEFLARPLGDLYICGSVGAGKTRLACTLLNEFYRTKRRGMFTRVGSLLHNLMPSALEHVREATEVAVRTEPMLVLDDIGADRDQPSDFTRRTLLMIYEDRCDAGLRTIWTSNKTPTELGQILDDDRLVSRIFGRSDVVEISCPDQRITRRA